jgi:hypothetical protein
MRRYHPERFGDTPIDMVRATLGNAMEKAIAAAMERKTPGRYITLPELEFDGLFGNLDVFDCKDDAVVEIKLTWASVRRVHDDGIDGQWFWRYWAQGKAYAKMMGVNKVRLMIVFINGDWKRSPPQGFIWEDEFDDDELDENWAMIKRYSKLEKGQKRRRRGR